jgi:predicted patatin/cPLA2 family phospholipase
MHRDARIPKYWNVNHPVLELLRRRREDQSQPGCRRVEDQAKLGLVIEGGGMRGIVSASMLAALEDLGYRDSIDAVYGVSAGSINGAYFLGGDMWYASSIYYDDLVTGRFVDFKRAFTRRSIMDLSYVIDYVMDQIKPLRYSKILASAIPLNVAVTDVDDIKTVVLSEFATATALKESLRAGAWLPIGVRGTATHMGRRTIDGGVLVSMPHHLAINDKCTHVLSLSTKRIDAPPPRISPMTRYARGYLNRLNPGLGDEYINTILRKRVDHSLARIQSVGVEDDPPFVLDVAPLPSADTIKRHEVRHDRLIRSARHSYAVMWATLEGRRLNDVETGLIRAIPHFNIPANGEAGI